MKKWLLLSVISLCYLSLVAQRGPMYVAAKAGLSIRETPSPSGKVLDKIPYGEKITIIFTQNDSLISIPTEGFNGSWVKTTWKGKTGYVVNSYLFPMPPPKATVKTLKDYLAQLSAVAGPAVTVKKETMGIDEPFSTTLKKQLYKNGAEYHEYFAYEYGSQAFFIPGFTIEQGFLLLRLLKEFPDVIADNDPLPKNNSTKKLRNGDRKITVEKEDFGGDYIQLRKIKMDWEDGAVYFLEIYELDVQLVIFTGSGV